MLRSKSNTVTKLTVASTDHVSKVTRMITMITKAVGGIVMHMKNFVATTIVIAVRGSKVLVAWPHPQQPVHINSKTKTEVVVKSSRTSRSSSRTGSSNQGEDKQRRRHPNGDDLPVAMADKTDQS